MNGVIDRGERFLTRPSSSSTHCSTTHSSVVGTFVLDVEFCEMVDMWVQLYHSLTLMEEQYSKPKINKRFIQLYILIFYIKSQTVTETKKIN